MYRPQYHPIKQHLPWVLVGIITVFLSSIPMTVLAEDETKGTFTRLGIGGCGGANICDPVHVSDDGSVVVSVGYSNGKYNYWHWTVGGGQKSLGFRLIDPEA